MKNNRISRLLKKFDLEQALDTMSARMKRHELITYFMALVSRRSAAVAPADVLHQMESDRFVVPSAASQRFVFVRASAILGRRPSIIRCSVLTSGCLRWLLPGYR